MDSYRHDGLTFDVLDQGPTDGIPVVLLHGFPQDATSWARVSDLLGAAGCRTLAPDQRGYSPGARPPEISAYAVRHLVGDVVALLDAAGLERTHLVGHDWGGGVAWECAARHPGRFASLTVVSTPHPRALDWAFRHSDQGLRSWYMLAFQLPWLPERLLVRGFSARLQRTGMPPALAEHYAARFATPADLFGPVAWYRAAFALPQPGRVRPPILSNSPSARAARDPDARETRETREARETRHTVTIPTTYVWGNTDFALGRAAAERTARHVSGDYRFVELDGGHWLPETHPEELAGEILARAAAS